MAPPAATPLIRAARERFRAAGRAVLRDPGLWSAHLARLSAAAEMPGAEPVQGALADLFLGCRHAPHQAKRAALESVRRRLGTHAARRFEDCVNTEAFAACNRLATRFSVLAEVSLDVPRRTLRCSGDDSRRLATRAVAAWRQGDADAQQGFLDHCVVCGDTLAFLLARRVLLREALNLPPPWKHACEALQRMVLS
jgi:hypothetical protein